LILEDGTVLRGRAFGAEVESIAELVFNTSITGYQEILTDPSYRGQTVMLTQPHIGNYGVNSEDEESAHIWTSGLIVREACGRSSNFRSGGDLSDYLAQHGVPGIEEVDTRLLTRRVRSGGAMRVLITPEMDTPLEKLLERLREAPTVSDEDHVKVVSTNEIQSWTRGYESPFAPALENDSKQPISSRFRSSPTTSASSATSCARWSRAASRSRWSPLTPRPRWSWSESPGACSSATAPATRR
ncbi:MAG: carbamoyl-phosphate synthase domain-containing protein, partial [Planctomycetota bacterium]